MRVGFIGLGIIGSQLTPKLIEAGNELTVTELVRSKAAKIEDLGASWADTAREVGEANEVVFTSVPNPEDVEKVLLTPKTGLLEGLAPGKVFIDLTTSSPTMSRKLAAICKERGVEMLDSPLTRASGTIFVVGGDKATFERHKHLMEAMGSRVFYVGGTGMGNVAKLALQYTTTLSFWAQMEALVIAAKAGADTEVVHDFLVAAGNRPVPDFEKVREHEYGERDAGSLLDIFQKDVSLGIQLAREIGAIASLGVAADDIMRRGQTHEGWGRYHRAIATQVLEEFAGVDLKGRPYPPSK